MFRAAEYKCSKCGAPKRGHWCPADALQQQSKGLLSQLGAVEAPLDLPALVLDQKLRLVAMMPPPTEVEADDTLPLAAPPAPLNRCPRGAACRDIFCTYTNHTPLRPLTEMIPRVPLVYPSATTTPAAASSARGLPPRPPTPGPSGGPPTLQTQMAAILQHFLSIRQRQQQQGRAGPSGVP